MYFVLPKWPISIYPKQRPNHPIHIILSIHFNKRKRNIQRQLKRRQTKIHMINLKLGQLPHINILHSSCKTTNMITVLDIIFNNLNLRYRLMVQVQVD